jgi:L-lysine 6-transaminase
MSIDPKKVKEILSKNILADGFVPIMDLEKSKGSYIVDQVTGDSYLDMFSMFASASIGYNHPNILKNKKLLTSVSLIKPTLSDLYNVHYADFVDTFNRLAIPKYLQHAFFVEGGTLAVENALKVAFDWKVRKNLKIGIKDKGTQIIHFKQAFHGRSGYTLSLTNTTDPRKTMYFPKFDWPRISNPYIKFPMSTEELKILKKQERDSILEIKDAIIKNPNDIAAVIIEPIQGEGGDNFFRDDFFISLREICDENNMLLIFDEVQTGIGITGKMWAYQHYSIQPDILCFAKKAQVGGILASKRIDEVKNNVFVESSRINSTFGGNLVDMIRFQIILNTIKEEKLLDNSKKVGSYLLSRLIDLQKQYPAYVTNARGLGLWAAFDLPSMTERDELWERMMKNKLLILTSGDKSIRFRPHLTTNKQEIDLAIDIIDLSIKKCLK